MNRIYYFSTTGNSLVLAKALAKQLKGAELVSIPSVSDDTVHLEGERIGIIFPVYGWGLPRMVAEFVSRVKPSGNPYLFAIATCGGTPGPALRELRGLLCKAGMVLNAGFVCTEGANTVTDDPGFIRFIRKLGRIQYPSASERLAEIATTVQGKKEHKLETSSLPCNLLTGLLRGMMKGAAEKLKAADENFSVDSNCVGCRTCERVCPRGNVKLESGKPVWHHNCEMCYGCIQWCPQQAIHVANDTRRYRNPSVRAEDMMVR